jgi:hypothetical protein
MGESEYPAVKNTTKAAAAKRRGGPVGPVFGKYCAQTMIRLNKSDHGRGE